VSAGENAIGGTSQLKGHIFESLNEEEKAWVEEHVGFPNAAVDRIIPPSKGNKHPADAVVEKFFEWDVEKAPLKLDLLPVEGLHVVDDLSVFLERKLFTLNGPNAVTACYGYLKGYETIQEALDDSEIRDVVWGMMEECNAMLEKRHPFTAEELLAYRTKIMSRFRNPHIIDFNLRVAREPIRKLSPNDRIVCAMNFAHGYGIDTPSYYTGIAAVLMYDNENDEQSQRIQQLLKEKGVAGTLEEVSGLSADDPAVAKIAAEYARLKAKY